MEKKKIESQEKKSQENACDKKNSSAEDVFATFKSYNIIKKTDKRIKEKINTFKLDTYHRWIEVFILSSLLELPTVTIPIGFNKIWRKGLETGSYYLKLCGSGGGGYLIGFSDDLDKAEKELLDYKFQEIIKF